MRLPLLLTVCLALALAFSMVCLAVRCWTPYPSGKRGRFRISFGRWSFSLRFMRTNRIGWFRDEPFSQVCLPGWNPSGNVAGGFFLLTYMARMKERSASMRPVVIALVALSTLALAGCTTPVGKQLQTERAGFNATLEGIHVAHIAGAVTATQEKSIEPYLKVAQAALDAGDQAFRDGNTSQAKVYLKAAVAGIAKVASVYGTPTASAVK